MIGPDAYESMTSHVSEPPWTRVYRPGGRYAHYEEAGSSCPVVLRFLPRDDGDFYGVRTWMGTGSQEEYEQAARLPLCLYCFRRREAGNAPDLIRLGSGHGEEM